MSKHVYWLLALSIKEGELENLKSIMAEMVEATQANEAGTLSYEWSVSGDGKTCFIFERYADSAAVMIHLNTFGEKFSERMFRTVEVQSFRYYGSPNDEVKETLGGFGAVFHESIGGFTR